MANKLVEINRYPLKTGKGHFNNTANTKEGSDGQILKKIEIDCVSIWVFAKLSGQTVF